VPPHAAVASSHQTTSHGSPHVTGSTHATTAPATHPTASHTAGKPPKTKAGGTTAPTAGTTTTSPIAQKIASHPQLAAKLQPMLPAGMTLDTAAAGFRNQGQFIAALHVSQNLGIPFTQVKAQMVDKHRSLGQTIQTLKPGADAGAAEHEATAQADSDARTK
jgi:hypothetical protein